MERRKMYSTNSLGLRKGAWTQEEDILLKKCIEKYGAEKWHQIPIRAGLNRCRKSCRLRWLNYLKPNLNRGSFTEDEDDLIMRLHKLLGNRWSLIAGRLPGRTAKCYMFINRWSLIAGRLPGRTGNDVKNYWNSNLKKKLLIPKEDENSDKITKANIVKPRPRSFSRNIQSYSEGKSTGRCVANIHLPEANNCEPLPENADDVAEWWVNMLTQLENNGEVADPVSHDHFSDQMNPTNEKEKEGWDVNGEMNPTNEIGYLSNFLKEDGQMQWNTELFDIDTWDNI